MGNVFKVISDALKEAGYPVSEQGSYSPDEVLPDTFITYLILDSPNTSHADNLPTSTTWLVQLALYSKQPLIVQSAEDTFKGLLLPSGFLRVSGRSLPFNSLTGHYGWTCDYRYYESE